MVNAIVLVNVDRGHVNDIAEELVELDGVTEVFSVAGRYDLAAILRSSSNERIAQLVTRHIMDMEHITHTETLMAFQAYSKYDLEAMFSIGLGVAHATNILSTATSNCARLPTSKTRSTTGAYLSMSLSPVAHSIGGSGLSQMVRWLRRASWLKISSRGSL